ncbi:MAG: hypothetical protein ACLVKO_07565 [Dysgonomonas sp.]
MKTIYKSVILFTAGLVSVANLAAQNASPKDSTLNRQILLEREFNPTLQDASKINTVPAIHEPVVKPAQIQFETKQADLQFQTYPVGDTGSGDIATGVDFSKKRGYLSFAGGNYMNLKGTLGYRVVDEKNDRLDFFFRHNSTNGDVKYADKTNGLDKAKAKYMNNFVKAEYEHSFEFLSWFLNAKFDGTSFNYYGNPFSANSFEMDKKQNVNSFGAETGVKSNENNEFVYSGSLSFDHFSAKYGPLVADDGVSGNIIRAKFDMAAPMSGYRNLIGLKLGVMNQGFSDVKFAEKDIDFHSFTRLHATPYFRINGDDYSVSLGVNFDYAIDQENKFVVSPDVKMNWQFADKTSLYLNATGGVNENDYLSIMAENRYVDMSRKVAYSRTLADATLGIKSGIINGFEFDVFAGYKYTKDEHLYSSESNGNFYSWANISDVRYYDVGVGSIGALIKTNLIPYTDLSAKFVGYFYDVTDNNDYIGGAIPEEKPWNLPKATLNINADFHPLKELKLSVGYYLATGRETEYMGKSIDMKNISELNIGADYQILDWVTVFARLNNVLNQKYETWYGYTHQGFNVMGGVSLKF